MIAHIDVDAFFASVLVRKDPRLKGKPLLALGMGGGCVIAASYEAKAKGVKTGMRVSEARKLCPQAIERISDFAEACRASAHIEEILERQCPVMEKMSVDEWFLDLTTLVGAVPHDLGQWATAIQRTIQQHLALSVSIGIGPTKTLSKMASEYRKPAGITILTPENHAQKNSQLVSAKTGVGVGFSISNSQFLRDRPAAAIPGIGHARTKHTELHGWKTAWDFAHASANTVVQLFGKQGKELQQELSGVSAYPVQVDDRPPKSISRCRSFRKTHNAMSVYAQLQEHITVAVLRMRKEHLSARNISIWLRDHAYKHAAADIRLPRPMDTEEELLPYAKRLFQQIWKPTGACTQVGLALGNLTPAGGRQYSLFEHPDKLQHHERIQGALDTIHTRFGRDALVRGPVIGLGRERKKRERTMVGDV